MKYLQFVLLFSLFSCKNTSNTDGTSRESREGGKEAVKMPVETEKQAVLEQQTDTIVKNFTVVPQQQVGLITADMTEADLKKVYGEKNVGRVERGDVKTVIYPNSNNELEISWKKGQAYKKLETAIIRKGDWKTAEGIRIGTTEEELSTINGKKIELYTLEEGVAIVRWKNGNVNPKLKILVNRDTHKVTEMQIDF